MIILSICIPTFNRAEILRRNLALLLPQCAGKPVEVCVSNNASTDGTAEILASFQGIRVQIQESNIGIDRNILAALRMGEGKFVLPIGDDETFLPHSVDAILEALRPEPDMLILNGCFCGIITDLTDAFRRLWDQMPLGGFAIRREYAAAGFTDRYLGTHHAYSGAAWDFLLTISSPRIACTPRAVILFNDVAKAWEPDRRRILTEEIPRWFDLIPAYYKPAVETSRARYQQTWGNEKPTSRAWILFVVGLALGIPFNLVGNLLAGEFLLAIAAVVGVLANFRKPRYFDRQLVLFTCLFSLSLCVYMTTDLLWGTPLHDAARGWARFIFLIADFTGFYVIARRSRFNLFPLLIGYMLSQVAVWFVPGPERNWYVTTWKHHLCLPVILGLLCLAGLRRPRFAVNLAVLAGAGLLSFQVDTRAFGMLCFVSSAIISARVLVTGRMRKLMPIILMAGLVSASLVTSSILGRTSSQFGRRQSGSNELRYAAILTASQTIARHPWIGVGSWKNDFEAASRHRANLIEAGGRQDTEPFDQSGHSQLLQTWLEGGPVAAVAFLYLLWRMLRSLQWTLYRPADRFLTFSVFLLLNGIWTCLFSPFLGADVRVNAALCIYVCVEMAREKMNLSLAHA